jgi:hypothetical protein
MAYGLQARGTQILRNGEPFKNYGVSHYDIFIREFFDTGAINTGLENDIRGMKARGIKIVRICGGMLAYGSLWYTYYFASSAAKANFYTQLRRVLDAFHAHDMGVNLTIGWGMRAFTEVTYYLYGATDPPKNVAYPHTRAGSLLTQYITEYMTQVGNHPAVWMWSIFTEESEKHPEINQAWPLDGTYNTYVDYGVKPEGGTYPKGSQMTMPEWIRFTQRYVNLIRSYDKHARIIHVSESTGTVFGVNQFLTGDVSRNSKSQFDGQSYTNFQPWLGFRDLAFDAITTKVYMLNARPAPNNWFTDAVRTAADMIALGKEWADACGKPYILEEYGASQYDPLDTESWGDPVKESTNFFTMLNGIAAADVALSFCWNYRGDVTSGIQPQTGDMTDPTRVYQLDAIEAMNAAL